MPCRLGLLPIHSSAPKLLRMGTNAWKTRALRTIQGTMQARHRTAASAMRGTWRAMDPVPFRIQKAQKGRKMAMEALLRVMSPQSSPKMAQRFVEAASFSVGPPMFLMRRASTRMQEKRKAVRDISQTHFTAYCIAAG